MTFQEALPHLLKGQRIYSVVDGTFGPYSFHVQLTAGELVTDEGSPYRLDGEALLANWYLVPLKITLTQGYFDQCVQEAYSFFNPHSTRVQPEDFVKQLKNILFGRNHV